MSTSLKLLGATLTSNSTTSVADFSNFAKVKVAASNADDAAARNDYVNAKIIEINNNNNNNSVLKLSSSTVTLSSSGEITANKSYISVIRDANSSSSLLNIKSVNTLEHGAVIVLQANNPLSSSSITVTSNKHIRLNNHAPFFLTDCNTLQLLYNSVYNSWIELNRTIIVAPISHNLSLKDISKFRNDLPFSLSDPSLVSKNGSGDLSFSSSNTSVAIINDDIVTIVGAGDVTITVSLTESDDGVYYAATTTAKLTVKRIIPTLYLGNIRKIEIDAPFSLTSLVTKTGTGVLSYSLSSSSVATISGDMLTIVGVGNVYITVSLAVSADDVYDQATTTAMLTVVPYYETSLVDGKVYAVYSSVLNDAIQGSDTFFTLRFFLGVNQFPQGVNLYSIAASITAQSGDYWGNATNIYDSATFSDGCLVITGSGSTPYYFLRNGYSVSIVLFNRIEPTGSVTVWNSFNYNYSYTIELTGLPVLTVSLVQTATPGNFLLQTPNVGAPFSYKVGYRRTDSPSDPLNYLPSIYVADGNNYSISIPGLQVGVSYRFEVELWHNQYNESRKGLIPNQIFSYTI